MTGASKFVVRRAQASDIPGIIEMCRLVYPTSPPWAEVQLRSHQSLFSEGQLVAVNPTTHEVIGYASCLVVCWDDYEWDTSWRDFTDHGMFTNHDPANGRTLYGAEIMVKPTYQGTGVGKALYVEREALTKRLGLLRIRAGARLRGYHQFAAQMSADDYVQMVVDKKHFDPTLSFQLNRNFHVLKTISGYLRNDPESLGYAAVIEWLNIDVAKPEDFEHVKESKFYRDPAKKQ
jgi:GNAT superfamily N-acetyltransferase